MARLLLMFLVLLFEPFLIHGFLHLGVVILLHFPTGMVGQVLVGDTIGV